ncbi:MAG: YMGG-like glycine zipper-containing protein [Thermodesulfobacteriota bacterium]
MKHAAVLIMVVALLVGGCVGADKSTAYRTVGGSAIGAGGGALIGWAAGSPAAGAAVGAAAGALGGYAYDQYEKSRGR